MSSVGPGAGDPDGDGVPVGPEPEPTGAGGAGSGGWAGEPRTEPFAIAALVWAIVSIVLPIVGTIVAFVLAARASDSIRRSQGARGGAGMVTAARVVAGVVIGLWAVGLIAFVALRDDPDPSNVAVPTQPTSTSTSTTTTTGPPLTTTTLATTTTTAPPTTTAPVAPTTSVLPPPPTTAAPPTQAPTTTEPPTTAPPTTQPPTTQPPTTTTTPEQREEARIQNRLLRTTGPPETRIGPSDRGVPDDDRVVVTYVVGQPLQVRWAINDGAAPRPVGTPTCAAPPTPPDSTTTTTTTTTPPASSTSTTTSTPTTTSSPPPAELTTPQLARREARRILNLLANEIENENLDIDGVQLVGTFPISGPDDAEADVVQVFYTNAGAEDDWAFTEAFDAPPAVAVQCLNPAFA